MSSASSSRKRRRRDHHAGSSAVAHGSSHDDITAANRLLQWLTSQGATGLTELRVAPGVHGLGVFAGPAGIEAGGVLASIPRPVVLTVPRSMRSDVGCACAAFVAASRAAAASAASGVDGAVERVPTSEAASAPAPAAPSISCELVLWLDMVAGRHDATHPSHAYLAALPSSMPDCASWPPHARAGLAGTNAGAAAEAASQNLEAEYAAWVPRLQQAHPVLFRAHHSLDAVRWARR